MEGIRRREIVARTPLVKRERRGRQRRRRRRRTDKTRGEISVIRRGSLLDRGLLPDQPMERSWLKRRRYSQLLEGVGADVVPESAAGGVCSSPRARSRASIRADTSRSAIRVRANHPSASRISSSNTAMYGAEVASWQCDSARV